MKNPNVKKLKYPIWFKIVFYILTVILPLGLILTEGLNAPSATFRITFGVIVALLITWTFINKFIIINFVKRIEEEKVKLEHEYRLEIGNKNNCKWLWFTNEQKMTIINAIQIFLIGSLIIVITTGIANGFITVRATSIIIALSYLMAYIIKFITITVLKGKEEDEEEGSLDEKQ